MTTEYALANHYSIITGDKPEGLTTQSAELYHRLTLPRMRVALQQLHMRFPSSLWYDAPKLIH